MTRDPVARMLAAYPVVHHACRQRVAGEGTGRERISAHQATILAHLDRAAGCTVTELARLMGVALPTMSLLVSRLARAGLVRRERDRRDRRRAALRLSATGERVRAGSSLLDPERVRALLYRLTPEERTLGVDGLVALARAARSLPPPPGASAER
jgi:DNA-binding MarR family transcriptional regulator